MHEDELSGCSQCYQADAQAMGRTWYHFQAIARLVDESHFGIQILACPTCGLRWVSIFTERIDWQDGDDPQCSDLLPVTTGESQKLIDLGETAVGLIESIGKDRRFLRDDHPKGAPRRTTWVNGGLYIGCPMRRVEKSWCVSTGGAQSLLTM